MHGGDLDFSIFTKEKHKETRREKKKVRGNDKKG